DGWNGVDFDLHRARRRKLLAELGGTRDDVGDVDGAECDVRPRGAHYGEYVVGETDEPLGLRFDYLDRLVMLGLIAGALEPENLHEQQDVLQRRAQLVRDVREKHLPRFHEPELPAHHRERRDGEYDAADQQHERAREA